MKLFVGNLSFESTELGLQDAFAQYGTVTECKIMQDRTTGRSRGFAFITMSSDDEGQAAIRALNGKALDGRPLRVNEARPREEGAGGGGGRPPRSFGDRDGGKRSFSKRY